MLVLTIVGVILLILGIAITVNAIDPPIAYMGMAVTVFGFVIVLVLSFVGLMRLWV